MNAARKIGYSFLGLLAGNVALFSFLLADAKVRGIKDIAFYMLPFYLLFSIFGWILVGIPFVLVIQSEVITELHWLIVILIGLFLGALAQFFIFFLFEITGHLNLAGHWRGVAQYEELAMVISVVAFLVYWLLARRTLRQNENGASLNDAP